jgi:hypothetical protein
MGRSIARWLTVLLLSAATLVSGLMASFILVPGAAAATILYVAPSGSGGGSCATPDYTTIQDAINAASSGDTVLVCAGSYSENITIAKSLTLDGAQAGTRVDSRTAGGPNESTINGIGSVAVRINADNVTVDGFTVTNPNGSTGIYANERSNITITNNFVTDVANPALTPVEGIYVHSYSASIDNILIQNNSVQDIHQTGGHASAIGIYVGDSNGLGTTIDHLVIQGNTVSAVTARTDAFPVGHGAYGISINHGTTPSAGSTRNAQVIDNTIANIEGLWAHGIGLEGDTPNVMVERNTISHLTDYKNPSDAVAVNVEDNDSASTIDLRFNNFSAVNIGVQNNTTQAVNAKFNWWGCSMGPGYAGCATTVGRVVAQPALRQPYVDYSNQGTSPQGQFIGNILNGIFVPRFGR